MPSGRKEKDVLARQKQLAAIMAAKRKPAATGSGSSVSASASSSSGPASKRPRVRGRSSKPSPVIDLTESEKKSASCGSTSTRSSTSSTSQKKEVVMGIHKSFKRQSASSVMAAARAKAMQKRLEESGNAGNNDEDPNNKDKKNTGATETTKSSKSETENKDNNAGKKAPKKRLANLVQNAAASTTGNKDDWNSGAATSNITPDDFWKNIRKWDFVGELAKLQLENSNSNNNSNSNSGQNKSRDDKTERDENTFVKVVPNTFINARHYVSVWAPLCLAECRAQLLSDIVTECGQIRGGRNASPFILVKVETTWKTGRHGNRDAIPGAEFFSEITDSCQVILNIPEGQGRNNNYGRLQFFPHDICCLIPVEKKDLVENLLFRGSGGGGRGGGQNQNHNRFAVEDPDSEVFKHACIVGHTETHRKDVHGLIMRVSKRKWAQVGSCNSGGGKGGSGAQMYFFKIGCNITALREFTALSSVDTIPLKNNLLGTKLKPKEKNKTDDDGDDGDGDGDGNDNDDHQHQNDPRTKRNRKRRHQKGGNGNPDPRHTNKDSLIKMMGGVEALGKGFTEYARKKFNPSQLMAISASSQGYGDGGFTLIKGPPGTGKTTTLVNILNALHIRQFNKYYEEVRKIVALQTGNRQTALEIARRAKPRLLVCAPSNAAVDNVILKIMEDGFIDGRGQRYNPSITRIGVGQSASVKDVALETKVDQILSDNSDLQQLENSIAGFRMELQRITTDIMKCRKRIHAIANASPWPLGKDWEIRVEEQNFDEFGRVFFVNHKDHSTTYECPPPPEPGEKQFAAKSMPEYHAFMGRTVKLVESYFRIKTNLEQATIAKGSMGNGARHFEIKQNLEMHVLNSVHIVMTTLGTAGNRALEGVDKFEVVVIDEAAQSVEPATLAAMQLGSRHCVMVGDPQQLPATIFNVSGKNSKYDRSLFQRLEEAGEKVYMLNEQYRMHPKISHFPRHIFYKGALKDGPNVRKPDYGNPLVETITSRIPAFQPFTVLDLDSKEERGGTSLSNSTEADLAVYLYDSLKKITNGMSASSRVAVITPYSQQAGLLRRKFGDLLGKDYTQFVEVNTVDAFQGREAKIVIFSAVRAAGSHGIGFLSDVRRMNVALTRAKHFLFVIARCKSIVVNPYWKDLVEHARDTNAVVSVPMRRKGKKGKANFPPVQEWRLVGSPSNQPPPAPPGPQAAPPPPPPPPPPSERSSFQDQLAFFRNTSNNVASHNINAHAQPPMPPNQPQQQTYVSTSIPPPQPPGVAPQYHMSGVGHHSPPPPPPPPPQPAPLVFTSSGISAPPPQQHAPLVFTSSGISAPLQPPPAPSMYAPSNMAPPPQPQPAPLMYASSNMAPPPQPPPAPLMYETSGMAPPPQPPPAPPMYAPSGMNPAPQPPPAPSMYAPSGMAPAPQPPPAPPMYAHSGMAPAPQPPPAPPMYAPSGMAPAPQPPPAPPMYVHSGMAPPPQPPHLAPSTFASYPPPAPAPPPPPPPPVLSDPRNGAPMQGGNANDPRLNYNNNMDPRRRR